MCKQTFKILDREVNIHTYGYDDDSHPFRSAYADTWTCELSFGGGSGERCFGLGSDYTSLGGTKKECEEKMRIYIQNEIIFLTNLLQNLMDNKCH